MAGWLCTDFHVAAGCFWSSMFYSLIYPMATTLFLCAQKRAWADRGKHILQILQLSKNCHLSRIPMICQLLPQNILLIMIQDAMGIAIRATDGSFNDKIVNFSIDNIPVNHLSLGNHTLFVRGKSQLETWGQTEKIQFSRVEKNPPLSK